MSLELLISILSTIFFLVIFWLVKIISTAKKAINTIFDGLSILLDKELDDREKEINIKNTGLLLIKISLEILAKIFISILIALIPIFLADYFNYINKEATFDFIFSWKYILTTTIIIFIFLNIYKKKNSLSTTKISDSNQYSPAEKFIHRLVFFSPKVLKKISKFEDAYFSRINDIDINQPIFITSLARGGTTALLNVISELPNIVTHTYQHMPLITSPIIWEKLKMFKKKEITDYERAHGDGIKINLNSPEAFEEIIWKLSYPEKFLSHHITLFETKDLNNHKELFFINHIKKMILLKGSKINNNNLNNIRYCSKNNGNIARIPLLLKLFPDSKIVVPIRRPECHAKSLLNQHINFSNLQNKDNFIRQYMEDICHFDFGLIHKTINFPNFIKEAYDINTSNYWLNYWIYAFKYIMQFKKNCIFIPQDDLRGSPNKTIKNLLSDLNLFSDIKAFDSYFIQKLDNAEISDFSKDLYRDATDVYLNIIEQGN